MDTNVMPKKKSEHYVNNKEFLEALVIYRQSCFRSKEAGLPKPRITNYLGECFLKIATHLSYKPNFVNYMFRDDMISDGVENCVQYIHNFDPEAIWMFAEAFSQKLKLFSLRLVQALMDGVQNLLCLFNHSQCSADRSIRLAFCDHDFRCAANTHTRVSHLGDKVHQCA